MKLSFFPPLFPIRVSKPKILLYCFSKFPTCLPSQSITVPIFARQVASSGPEQRIKEIFSNIFHFFYLSVFHISVFLFPSFEALFSFLSVSSLSCFSFSHSLFSSFPPLLFSSPHVSPLGPAETRQTEPSHSSPPDCCLRWKQKIINISIFKNFPTGDEAGQKDQGNKNRDLYHVGC